MAHSIAQVIFKGRVVQSVPLDRPSLRIGRLKDNDIVIDNLSVSRHHATLRLCDEDVVLEDQGSENGCLVNGRRVERAAITPEDDVWIGKHQLRLRPPESDTAVRASAAAPARTPAATPWDGERTYYLPFDADPTDEEELEPGSAEEMHAGLIVQRQGRFEGVVPVAGCPFVIGRSQECALTLSHPGVSRQHAQIVHEANGWELEDLGSVNGTRVNDHAVQRRRLDVGDEIGIGEFQLTFVLEPKPLEEEIRLETRSLREPGLREDDTEPSNAVTGLPLRAEALPDGPATPEPTPSVPAAGAPLAHAAEERADLFDLEPGGPDGAERLDAFPEPQPELEAPEHGVSPERAESDLEPVRALDVPVATPAGLAAGRLALELELDEGDLPEALREALCQAGPEPLRIPVTLRLRRAR